MNNFDYNFLNNFWNSTLTTNDASLGVMTISQDGYSDGETCASDVSVLQLESRLDGVSAKQCRDNEVVMDRLMVLEEENETLRRELRRCQTQVNNILALLQTAYTSE